MDHFQGSSGDYAAAAASDAARAAKTNEERIHQLEGKVKRLEQVMDDLIRRNGLASRPGPMSRG
jgi:hypothetical protein